jgi:hypothetical protein
MVYDGLSPDRLIFSGNSLSDKKLYLLYDSDTGHYNVNTNIKAAMAKRFVSNACDSLYDWTHTCDKACSLCTATPQSAKSDSRYCAACNRIFPSEKCFQNHLILRVKGKLVYQWRQICRNCSFVVTAGNKHECSKKFCNMCNKIKPSGHLCYMAPLKPSRLSKDSCTFSLIRSVSKILRRVMGLSNTYRILYVLSKCVQSVKPMMT